MLVTYFVNFRYLNGHLFEKGLFIRFIASAFRKLPSIYVFSYFPFGFEGRMWDLIVSAPDHCLSFYFVTAYFPCAKCFSSNAKKSQACNNRPKITVFNNLRKKLALVISHTF